MKSGLKKQDNVIVKFVNSVDPDEVGFNEPPHLIFTAHNIYFDSEYDKA